MIGTIIFKAEFDEAVYAQAANWCNQTQQGYIKDQGDYYEVIPMPSPSLEEGKQMLLKAIDRWTAEHITSGFVYNNVTYDSDKDTQITMQGIALNVHTDLFAERYPDGCPVRGYDAGSSEKTIHMLSADDVLGFCAALSIHIGETKKIGWMLQNAVQEAATMEELAAIAWPE